MGARKAKYENPGIAASFFYCPKKTMFGENQDVPLEEMGEQKEWNAKRAVLVTRNLQAIEGTRTEQLPSARRQATRFAYPREPVDTVQGEREKGIRQRVLEDRRWRHSSRKRRREER